MIDDMMQFVHTLGLHCNVYLLELRGHGLSEGRWSSHTEKADVAYVVSLIKKRYRTFILAKGASATLLLNQDTDGMIAISPKKSLPVRVHTPTIAINTHFTSIFGDVRFFQAQHLQLHHVISTALQDLQLRERPIAALRPRAR